MNRLALALLLLSSLGAPALADDSAAAEFAKGLIAENERGDHEAALRHYAKVQAGKSSYAREATRRRASLYWSTGDAGAFQREASYLDTFPGSPPSLRSGRKQPPAKRDIWPTRATWKREYERILSSRPVTLNVEKEPRGDYLIFVSDITALNFVATPEVNLEALITLRLVNTPVAEALRAILGKDLVLTLQAGAIVVSSKASPSLPRPTLAGIAAHSDLYVRSVQQRVSVQLDGVKLREVPRIFQEATGLNLVVHGEGNPRVTIFWHEQSLFWALQHLALASGMRVDFAHGAVHLGVSLPDLQTSRVGAPRTRLDMKVQGALASNFLSLKRHNTLEELLGFLADITDVNFHLLASERVRKTKLRVVMREVRLRDLLEIIASKLSLQVRFHNGVVVLCEGSKRLPKGLRRSEIKNAKIAKDLLSRRVSWSMSGVPAKEAIDFLRKETGWEVRTPGEFTANEAVSLRVKEVLLEDALHLAFSQAGLRYRVEETGLVIEAAK